MLEERPYLRHQIPHIIKFRGKFLSCIRNIRRSVEMILYPGKLALFIAARVTMNPTPVSTYVSEELVMDTPKFFIRGYRRCEQNALDI